MTEASEIESITIAVASDLHVTQGPTETTSFLHSDQSASADSNDPFHALLELIRREGLRADYLVCPGDIAHQADTAGLRHGWRLLTSLKSRLRARKLLATTGNHDLASRGPTACDPRDILKELRPKYPVCTESRRLEYWVNNFTDIRGSGVRFLVLNSCAHHAGPTEELAHGRVSGSTLAALRLHLEKSKPETANIMVCHHHPQQHQEIDLGDYDVMRNGQLLLDLLSEPGRGDWLVLHGHKHHPKITYAAGASTSPVVFSAGSLAACLYPSLGTRARNQFYLLTIPLVPIPNCGLSGEVRAWSWAYGLGWLRSDYSSGLPHSSGFGCRIDPKQLARAIAECADQPILPWQDVLKRLPFMRFVLTQDFQALRACLRDAFSLEIVMNDGQPYQLGRTLP